MILQFSHLLQNVRQNLAEMWKLWTDAHLYRIWSNKLSHVPFLVWSSTIPLQYTLSRSYSVATALFQLSSEYQCVLPRDEDDAQIHAGEALPSTSFESQHGSDQLLQSPDSGFVDRLNQMFYRPKTNQNKGTEQYFSCHSWLSMATRKLTKSARAREGWIKKSNQNQKYLLTHYATRLRQ